MAVTPNSLVTTQTVHTAGAVCTAAKSTTSDVANAAKILTAGTDGALVKTLQAFARATVTATRLDLWVTKSSDTGDAAPYWIGSVLLGANTLSSSAANPAADFGYTSTSPLRLDGGDKLWVSAAAALASGISFFAQYENF